jgi:hypothetical protein
MRTDGPETGADGSVCPWCARSFQARQTGGRSQRFCRPSCRRAFHAAARTWALDAIAAGHLTIGDLKAGFTATRTLRGEVADSVSAPLSPRPVSP